MFLLAAAGSSGSKTDLVRDTSDTSLVKRCEHRNAFTGEPECKEYLILVGGDGPELCDGARLGCETFADLVVQAVNGKGPATFAHPQHTRFSGYVFRQSHGCDCFSLVPQARWVLPQQV
jgi:hypothetical protein